MRSQFKNGSAIALALTMALGMVGVQAQETVTVNNVPVVTYGAKLSPQSGRLMTNRGFEAGGSAMSHAQQSGLQASESASHRSSHMAPPVQRASLAPVTAAPQSQNAYVTSASYAVAASQKISAEELERLRQLEAENAELRAQNVELQRVSAGGRSGNAADLPPSAKTGECYARVIIPGEYETLTERVLDQEASERIEVVPAEYNWDEERVLIREASERIDVIPATYKTITEMVEIEPARTELREIPARYETVSEKILVREAYTTWKKGTGPITRIDAATGEIMCLVEVPAEYRTVTSKKLVSPARTEEVFIPAKTKAVTKRVIDQPASTRTVPVPAQYETIRVRKIVRPAQERRIPVAATYKTVTKQRKVSDEQLEWREILCETNTTPDVIRRVQAALREAGYSPGLVDGVMGAQTISALRAYQVDQGLPSGQLTMATIRRLGVI